MINGWSHIAFMCYLVGVSHSQSLDGEVVYCSIKDCAFENLEFVAVAEAKMNQEK